MEKFESIIESIKSVNFEIRRLELLRSNRGWIFTGTTDSESLLNAALKSKILISNCRVAIFHQVIPVALEILQKYVGKPYGEKTRQKISDAVRDKTGCRFYISSKSYQVYPDAGLGTSCDIECGPKYVEGDRVPLLKDNKIQAVTFDNLELFYVSSEYVEDVPGRIDKLKEVYKQALEKQKELESICNAYNNLAVGDISHIYSNHYICSPMKV